MAFSGSHSDDELMAQEYTAGSGATWSAGATGSSSSTTSTVTFPSLTPSGAGQLYLGFAQVDGEGEAGSTPGFSYTITSAEGSVLCTDTNVSSTTSPTATQTGDGSDSVAGLFAASSGGGGTTTTSSSTTTTAATTTTTTGGSGQSTTYMIGLTGGVMLEVTGTTQDWYYPDLQGSTAAEASASGAAVGGITLYDPFGNALSPLQADSPDNLSYGFEGKHGIGTDTDVGGIVLMGVRLYDPATGRFLQVDAVFGGSCNAYDYARQNPLNLNDLGGQAACQKANSSKIKCSASAGDLSASCTLSIGPQKAEQILHILNTLPNAAGVSTAAGLVCAGVTLPADPVVAAVAGTACGVATAVGQQQYEDALQNAVSHKEYFVVSVTGSLGFGGWGVDSLDVNVQTSYNKKPLC